MTEPSLEERVRILENRVNAIEFRSKSSFNKPTVQEIQKYAKSINFHSLNASNFYDFYESKNWFVGKNKMKDWKACVRTWQRSQKPEESYSRVTVEQVKPRSKQEAEFLGREWNGN